MLWSQSYFKNISRAEESPQIIALAWPLPPITSILLINISTIYNKFPTCGDIKLVFIDEAYEGSEGGGGGVELLTDSIIDKKWFFRRNWPPWDKAMKIVL